MTSSSGRRFVSRGGDKLAAALEHFSIDPTGRLCADLGSHVGGFVDCLLQHGAARVYSVDTAYGELAWRLRKDPRVVVLERTNALHVVLPERVNLLTIDVGWTRQEAVLPHAAALLADGADVVTLIKPHYEAYPDERRGGLLRDDRLSDVLSRTIAGITAMGWNVCGTIESPLLGHAGNREILAWLRRAPGVDRLPQARVRDKLAEPPLHNRHP